MKASEAEDEVGVASEAKEEVTAASEGSVFLITYFPMSPWPLNAASASTNPSFNECSQDTFIFRSSSSVPQTVSGRAIDFQSFARK